VMGVCRLSYWPLVITCRDIADVQQRHMSSRVRLDWTTSLCKEVVGACLSKLPGHRGRAKTKGDGQKGGCAIVTRDLRFARAGRRGRAKQHGHALVLLF